jgi:hypothetical protein
MKPVTAGMSYWIAMRPETGVQRRDDAGRQADHEREQHRADREFDRRREARHELAEHRLVRDRREAEIAVQRAPHVFGVLDRQRAIEPELVHEARVAGRVHAALARERLDRVAGQEADQREHEQRDADEGRQHEAEALQQKGKHRWPSVNRTAAAGKRPRYTWQQEDAFRTASKH